MSNQKEKDLQWGEHNPKPTGEQSENHESEKTSEKDAGKPVEEEVDLSKQEPGRNRSGVKEGSSNISTDGQ